MGDAFKLILSAPSPKYRYLNISDKRFIFQISNESSILVSIKLNVCHKATSQNYSLLAQKLVIGMSVVINYQYQ